MRLTRDEVLERVMAIVPSDAPNLRCALAARIERLRTLIDGAECLNLSKGTLNKICRILRHLYDAQLKGRETDGGLPAKEADRTVAVVVSQWSRTGVSCPESRKSQPHHIDQLVMDFYIKESGRAGYAYRARTLTAAKAKAVKSRHFESEVIRIYTRDKYSPLATRVDGEWI